MAKPKQQTAQSKSNQQRRGGVAQADGIDHDTVAAIAQTIIAQEEEETITSREDYLLHSGMGATLLHPEEAFNGRS